MLCLGYYGFEINGNEMIIIQNNARGAILIDHVSNDKYIQDKKMHDYFRWFLDLYFGVMSSCVAFHSFPESYLSFRKPLNFSMHQYLACTPIKLFFCKIHCHGNHNCFWMQLTGKYIDVTDQWKILLTFPQPTKGVSNGTYHRACNELIAFRDVNQTFAAMRILCKCFK